MVSRAEWSDAAEPPAEHDPFVRVFGTRVHNLRGVDVAAPRDALVAFTGISGSGKSSLAFGTIYAEAQRRYFESVAPYARRLLLPTGAPKVDDITGLPPAVALQQRRGTATSRSSVGTVTTLSNLLRMLFSRAGTYPAGLHRATRLRRVLPEHRRRRVPGVPRSRPDPPGHRGDARSRPVADHPRGRRRRMAGRLAGPEPARHPHHARLRHRQAVAQAAEEATRLDPVHRRAADRRDRSEPAPGHRRLLLQRHVLQRRAPRPAHAGQLAERDDAQARAAVRRQRRLPGLRRLGAAARGAAVTFAGRNIAELRGACR